jgi:hypothetical protein
MNNFKFFTNTKLYNDSRVVVSEEAIAFVVSFLSEHLVREYTHTTLNASYNITQVTWENGRANRVIMEAFPFDDMLIKIKYHINAGNVVPYITEQTLTYRYETL